MKIHGRYRARDGVNPRDHGRRTARELLYTCVKKKERKSTRSTIKYDGIIVQNNMLRLNTTTAPLDKTKMPFIGDDGTT